MRGWGVADSCIHALLMEQGGDFQSTKLKGVGLGQDDKIYI